MSLADLSETIQESQGVDLIFEDEAVNEIARLGYDPLFGARPLRKAISDFIRAPMAEKILRGEIVKGSTVRVSFKEGGFEFG